MRPIALTSLITSLWILMVPAHAAAPETVSFQASDGLEVTADYYRVSKARAPLVVLFHQAGSSRGEYKDIAPRLNQLGFAALAVDQRSGRTDSGIANETAARAKEAGLSTGYEDARPDMEAAIEYARDLTEGPIVLWGSSYSASLVLMLAGEGEPVAAVLAFSPGEYFADKMAVQEAASYIDTPTFITSAREETDEWVQIFEAIPTGDKQGFVPPVAGRHGSSALKKLQGEQAEPYWRAVRAFLTRNFGL